MPLASVWTEEAAPVRIAPNAFLTVRCYVAASHTLLRTLRHYFLNDAVHLMEDCLKSAKNPPANAEVKYGERAEQCWNDDPNLPNYISRLHYNTMYLPKIRSASRRPRLRERT